MPRIGAGEFSVGNSRRVGRHCRPEGIDVSDSLQRGAIYVGPVDSRPALEIEPVELSALSEIRDRSGWDMVASE